MASLALGVKFNATSTGTVDFVDASAVTGYVRAVGTLVDGKTYRYRAESADLSQWEWGTGVWTNASSTLARTTISVSSTGAKVSFTAAPIVGVVPFPADLATLRGQIGGLTLSTAGSSATFGIAAGEAADSTNFELMALLSAFTKTTSTWALGTAAGSLDTGAIAASTWYHAYLIKRVDTGVVDVLISLSATAPTMPTNYTLFRRIGSMKTNGSSQWVGFTQNGDEFLWNVAVADASATYGATTALLTVLSVPTGVKVTTLTTFVLIQGATNGVFVLLTSPDQADTVPTSVLYSAFTNSSAVYHFGLRMIRTDTSGRVRHRSTSADLTYGFTTDGWIDRRGRDA